MSTLQPDLYVHLPALRLVAGVELDLNTAINSNATAEIWMPDESEWNGRFLAVGNGALGGFSKSPFGCAKATLIIAQSTTRPLSTLVWRTILRPSARTGDTPVRLRIGKTTT